MRCGGLSPGSAPANSAVSAICRGSNKSLAGVSRIEPAIRWVQRPGSELPRSHRPVQQLKLMKRARGKLRPIHRRPALISTADQQFNNRAGASPPHIFLISCTFAPIPIDCNNRSRETGNAAAGLRRLQAHLPLLGERRQCAGAVADERGEYK